MQAAVLPITEEQTITPPQKLSAFTSQKIRFWSFVSMFLLVFVHGYNLNERYLQPWSILNEPMTFTAYIEYFLANGIFRFRIPMLFIISGYLFAMTDYKSYGERTAKRVRTLLTPYLLWSAISLLFMLALEIIPSTKQLITDSHMSQIDEHRFYIRQYHWYEVVLRWIFGPPAYQLWFIRVLFIYNLAYPAIRWAVTNKYFKWFWFPAVVFLFISTFGTPIVEGEGLLFFSLGVWMQKSRFNIESHSRWLNPLSWGVILLLLTTIKSWLAFQGYALMGSAVFPVLALMHKAVIFSGLVAAWFGLNKLVRFFMSQQWFVWLSAFAFIIYAVHAPLVALMIDPFFNIVNDLPIYRLITFIFLPLLIIAFSIGIGIFLRRYTPKLYGVLTGGRGLH
jgi:fucose 4-O-acetylase-like acetyltransferase